MTGLLYAIRGSFGFSLRQGVMKDGGATVKELALDWKVSLVRCLKFSGDGAYMAYCDSTRTVVIEVCSGRELFSTGLPKTHEVFFSPRGAYLVTYQPYVIWGTRRNEDGSERVPDHNLRVWSVPDGRLLATTIADRQSPWRPQFTDDERLMFRQQGSELHVYEAPDFERCARKVAVEGLARFLLSPGADSHIACFIPSLEGRPAQIQIRQSSDELGLIQTETTSAATSCTMSWNAEGSAIVCGMGKTDNSYYSSSAMYCVPVRGKAFRVDLDKDGPIYSYEWSPDSRHFCVCYGYMPSRVSVFDLKGDVVWAPGGEGDHNKVHYNPFGSILAVCALGNLSSGKVHFWDVAKREEICSWNINCTTQFAWAPDGRHFIAATTQPMRIGHCYSIFDYKHILLHTQRYDDKEELCEAVWCPAPRGAFEDFEVEHLEDWQMEESARTVYLSKANPLRNYKVGELTRQQPGPKAPPSPGRYMPLAIRQHTRKASTTQPRMEPTTNVRRENLGPVAAKTKVVEGLRKRLADINELKEQRDRGAKLKIHQKWKIAAEDACAEELRRLTTTTKRGGSSVTGGASSATGGASSATGGASSAAGGASSAAGGGSDV